MTDILLTIIGVLVLIIILLIWRIQILNIQVDHAAFEAKHYKKHYYRLLYESYSDDVKKIWEDYRLAVIRILNHKQPIQ